MTDIQALAALLEQTVPCRRCGVAMVPGPTGEDLCGQCWRHSDLRVERQAQRVRDDGRKRARKGAQRG